MVHAFDVDPADAISIQGNAWYFQFAHHENNQEQWFDRLSPIGPKTHEVNDPMYSPEVNTFKVIQKIKIIMVPMFAMGLQQNRRRYDG